MTVKNNKRTESVLQEEDFDHIGIIKLTFGRKEKGKKEISELDFESSHYLLEKAKDVVRRGYSKVILDLQNVTYIDSEGIWTLYEMHANLKKICCGFVLLKPKGDVRRMLNAIKVSMKIKVFDDEKKAFNFLVET